MFYLASNGATKEKEKVVDVLTPGYDLVTRFQGGPNAGHTLEFEGSKFVLRPSHPEFSGR